MGRSNIGFFHGLPKSMSASFQTDKIESCWMVHLPASGPPLLCLDPWTLSGGAAQYRLVLVSPS